MKRKSIFIVIIFILFIGCKNNEQNKFTEVDTKISNEEGTHKIVDNEFSSNAIFDKNSDTNDNEVNSNIVIDVIAREMNADLYTIERKEKIDIISYMFSSPNKISIMNVRSSGGFFDYYVTEDNLITYQVDFMKSFWLDDNNYFIYPNYIYNYKLSQLVELDFQGMFVSDNISGVAPLFDKLAIMTTSNSGTKIYCYNYISESLNLLWSDDGSSESINYKTLRAYEDMILFEFYSHEVNQEGFDSYNRSIKAIDLNGKIVESYCFNQFQVIGDNIEGPLIIKSNSEFIGGVLNDGTLYNYDIGEYDNTFYYDDSLIILNSNKLHIIRDYKEHSYIDIGHITSDYDEYSVVIESDGIILYCYDNNQGLGHRYIITIE